MPSYNSETYIKDAVISALTQLEDEDEIVIQDGGSTDDTVKILTEMAEHDVRLKVVSEPDHGQSDALNKALVRASGDYILWLNSDDLIADNGIMSLKAAIKRNQQSTSLVFGGHAIVRADGSVISEYHPQVLEKSRLLSRGCYIFSGSIAIPRQTLNNVGGFSSHYEYCMDLDLFLRLLDYDASTAINIRSTVGILRWHDASKSGGSGWRFVLEGWRVRGSHLRGPGDHFVRCYAAVIQSIALATTPIRHSSVYTSIRNRFKR